MSAVLAIACALAGILGSASCKRRKPAIWTRAWLGPQHACSLQKTGALQCWGANEAGQLGDRTTTPHALPAPVVNGGRPDDVALGAHHTCALAGGTVKCWGDGSHGQLGTGLTTPLSAPTLPPLWHGAPLAGVTAIAAGGDQTCALAEDAVRCWGIGRVEPTAVQGLEHAAPPLAVGLQHVCAALTQPKAVRCSGSDDHGQSAGQNPILAGATIIGLTAGAKHTCALLEDGSVQCWGANDSGQLGDGTTLDSRVPALVSALPPALEIRAGATHTCARLRTNTVACWGGNAEHQLANGTSKPSGKPQPVPGLTGVLELAVAGDSACARLSEGDVRCWGANGAGQLGDGTTDPHTVPMPIRTPPPPR